MNIVISGEQAEFELEHVEHSYTTVGFTVDGKFTHEIFAKDENHYSDALAYIERVDYEAVGIK